MAQRGRAGDFSAWSLLRWLPPLLVLVALALTWWLTALRLNAQEQQRWAAARQQQTALAAQIHESLVRLVEKGQLMALAATDALEGAEPEGQTQHRLSAMLATDQALISCALLDAAGVERLACASPHASAAAAMEGEAAAHAMPSASQPQGPLQVTWVAPSPDQTRTGQISLLLRMTSAKGASGHLRLTLDLDYLLKPYRDVERGPGVRVHLLAADGEVLGEIQGNVLLWQPHRRHEALLAQQTGAYGHAQLALADQRQHLTSWRRSADAPFMVAVSQDLQQLQSQHHADSQRTLGLLSAMTVIILLVTWALARALGRQHGLFQALSAADDKNQLLIEQLEQEKVRALALAASDHLTGLHNRRMFNELVASHLALARRSTKHYALLYLDLDRFKHINDTLGHHVGDLLLQAVAQRLRALVRGSDIIGRLGGDEFALLVTAMETQTDMDQLAGKLIEQLSVPYTGLEGHSLHVTPSIGIAFFPRDGHDVATLCRHADAAMYAAKRAGRGRYTYYEVQRNPAADRSWQLERELAQAIASDQLVLYYQPKVRLEDCRIEGLEALVRWQHPDFGLIYPGEFISLAEKTGLITALGDWVIRAGCRQQAAWRRQGLETVPVAVNVSALQLRDTAFPTRVAICLQQCGVRASDLELEITESCLVEPVDLAVRVLNQLAGMGMRIGLDDFGTGFSSLSQIRDLPIDTLKLDRSFVDPIRSSPEAGVLVTSIITLAHNLKMRVVAEGVELREQLVYLKTAGCDVAQGYILSRPVPAEDAARLLRQAVLQPA